MKRRDWVLAVLSVADGATLTPVQLQKALFLLSKKKIPGLVRSGFYKFQPYAYGPFDRTVYLDANDLAAEGLVAIEQTPVSRRLYTVTSAGVDVVTGQPAFQEAKKEITEVVQWVQARSFAQLVSAIYEDYPEMKKNSIFRA